VSRHCTMCCPHCGEPWAGIVNIHSPDPDIHIDIHSGATYRCDECGGVVVLSVETPEEYAARHKEAP